MRTIITVAFAAGLVLTAAVVSFWATSLPAGNSLRSGSVDPHELTLKTKELPAQEISDLY
jgi:hypothetical protein